MLVNGGGVNEMASPRSPSRRSQGL